MKVRAVLAGSMVFVLVELALASKLGEPFRSILSILVAAVVYTVVSNLRSKPDW